MTEVQMSLLIACALLGLIGFVISLICVAMIAGFTRSTHTVQYMPVDNKEIENILAPSEDIARENEEALLSMVGRKKKTKLEVVDPLDAALEEIAKSDIQF